MKKNILPVLLFSLLFSFVSTSSSACDKVIKNPKSNKSSDHFKK